MSANNGKGPCFVDSNVWLYILLPGQDAQKAKIARRLVQEKESDIIVSVQIINEVVNGIIRNAVLDEAEIRELIHSFYKRYTVAVFQESIQLHASRLRERYSFSHWDSLIVATALHKDAPILYSEDMHHTLIVENKLTIVNPFRDDSLS